MHRILEIKFDTFKAPLFGLVLALPVLASIKS